MWTSSPPNEEALAEACLALGLAPPFTLAQAKSRYRELAKLYHPDVGMMKDAERFGKISRAYELVENNEKLFGAARLALSMRSDASRSKMQSLLTDLHQAQMENANLEAKARQMADEASALRRYYRTTGVTKRTIVLICAVVSVAALCLGLIGGVLLSYQSPIVELEGIRDLEAEVVLPGTLNAVFSGDGVSSNTQVSPSGSLKLRAVIPQTRIVLEGKNATFHTSPTVQMELTHFPALSGHLPDVQNGKLEINP